MLEDIHAFQRVVKQVTEQNAHSPAVHTNQDGAFLRSAQDGFNRGRHAADNIFRALTTFNAQPGVALAPFIKYIMVIGILFRGNRLPLFSTPRNLVEAAKNFVRYSVGNEIRDCFDASLQGRGIYLIKRYITVGPVKRLRLKAAKIVQAAVNPAALYNALQVKIGLPVANDV